MTDSYCLKRIKNKLGYPYQVIEKSDKDILEDIIHGDGRKLFSTHRPLQKYISNSDMIKSAIYKSVWEFPIDAEIVTVERVVDSSGLDMSFDFIHPNKIRIYRAVNINYTVITAKVLHSKDLTSIPYNEEDIFIELCTILLAEELLPIKKEFARVGTPIGDIEMDIETVQRYVDSKQDFFDKKLHNVSKLSKRLPLRFGASYMNEGK